MRGRQRAGQEEDLATEFFDKSEEEAVGFEIVLAALLATAVLAYPVGGKEIVGQLSAFGILLFTLIRRVALASPFAPEAEIMNKSVIPIEVATTSSLIYLVYSWAVKIRPVDFLLTDITTFSLLALVVFLGSVLIQEWMFRDYLAWWYAKFTERAEQVDHLSAFFTFAAHASYRYTRAKKSQESYRQFRDQTPVQLPDPNEIDLSKKDYLKPLIQGVVLLLVLYGVPFLISGIVMGPGGILAVAAVIAIHDHSCFWYIAYGNTSYEDLRKQFWVKIVLTTLFVGEVFLLAS